MTALVAAVLASSLLGSLHCAGMCGGFVALQAGAAGGPGRARRALSHGAYSAGRLWAYVLLGAGAGALGGALDMATALTGLERPAALLAGTLIVLWGLAALLEALGVRLPRAGSPRPLRRALGAGLRLVSGWPPPARAFVTGLLAAILPCGWLWAFVVVAAGSGHAAGGALVMLVFWVGTLPMLVTVGVLAETVAGPLRSRLPAAAAVAMILAGLLAVAGRGPAPDPALPASPVASSHAVPGGHAHR